MPSKHTEARWVRCPKCLEVLPEPTNVPVYRCGGCGATLKVKPRAANGDVSSKPLDKVNQKSLDRDSLSMSEKKEEDIAKGTKEKNPEFDNPASSINHNLHPEEDLPDKSLKEGDDKDPQICRGSSFVDDNCTHSDPKANSNFSESTKDSSNLPDLEQTKAEDGKLEMISNAAFFVQVHDQQTKPSNERENAAVAGMPDTSIGLENLHSVKNCLDSGHDHLQRSLAKDGVADDNSLNHGHRRSPSTDSSREILQEKVLNKVDKLRDELIELFSRSAERKLRTLSALAKQEGRSRHTVAGRLSSLPSAYHAGLFAAHKRWSSRHCLRGADPCYNSKFCMECGPKAVSCMSWAPDPKWKKPPEKEKRKQHAVVNHCRPVLGGTPFIICHYCLKLVHLPANFPVSRKTLHKLRCGYCSGILVYSYRDRARHPGVPADAAEKIDSVGQAPGFPRGDPISFSEEYGLSFGISNSTEAEAPLHVSKNSSFDSAEDGKGGVLHRLLGYLSASELLRQRSDSSVDTESLESCWRDQKGKAICMPKDPGAGCSDWISTMKKMDIRDGWPKKSRTKNAGLPLRGFLKN